MFIKKKQINTDPLFVEKQEQKFYIDNLSKGNIVLDVGANVGELTALFSRFVGATGKVHAFEATPNTYQRLLKVLELMNKNNVIANNLAVSNIDGKVTFNIYEDKYASWNTIAKRPLEKYGIEIDKPKSISVPSITIDSYCKTNNISFIDLLKIDVEGAELQVLQGAKKMFEEKCIGICVFEFGQTIHDMGHTAQDLILFFKQYNYKVKNVTSNQVLFPVNSSGLAAFSVHFAKPI